MRNQFANHLLIVILFLLPWQTAWIFSSVPLPTGETQYGVLLLYGTEILVAIATVLRGWPRLDQSVRTLLRPMYLILAAGFLSLTFSLAYSVGIFSLLHLVSACLLFLLLCDERTHVRSAILAFVLGLIPSCLLGWFQFVFGWSPAFSLLGPAAKDAHTLGIAVIETTQGRSLRAYGSFPHPNIFGGYLAFGIVCLGLCVRSLKTQTSRFLFAIPIVILSSTLILTFSRSAWLALTIALVLLLAIPFWKKRLVPHRAIPLMSLGLFSIAITILVFHSSVFARFTPSLRVESISLEERAGQYATLLPVVRINPLTGVGPGSYVFALAKQFPNLPAYSYQPIHNSFLLVVSEIGIIGLLAIAYALFHLWAMVHRSESFIGIVFAIATVSMLITIGLLDHYLWSIWAGNALVAITLAFVVRWQKSPS